VGTGIARYFFLFVCLTGLEINFDYLINISPSRGALLASEAKSGRESGFF
jgi:hypothetical protein